MDSLENKEKILAIAKKEATGDTDSIWIYGNQAQARLSEFSRTVARTVALSNNAQLENQLADMTKGIDQLSVPEKWRIFRSFGHKENQYKEILKSIDELAVQLRLRQAQLLKDEAIYARMEKQIKDCQDELTIYIEVGEEQLSRRSGIDNLAEDSWLHSDNQNYWSTRFGKRLDELRIARQIAAQGEVQMRLMRNNSSILAEKIASSLAVTIPVWRNQVALMLGLEDYSMRKDNQSYLEASVLKSAQIANKTTRTYLRAVKRKAKDDLDCSEVEVLNTGLKDTLNGIIDTERKRHNEESEITVLIDKISEIRPL